MVSAATTAFYGGFLDELEKIAAAHGQTMVSKARTGARPISVDNLVKKHNEGTWLKRADSQGNPQDVRGDSSDDPGSARAPRRRGETPTEGVGNIPQEQKTGMYRLSDTTLPVTTGEDMRAGNAAPAKPGDVPTQGALDSAGPVGRLEPRAAAITFDQSAKKPKKGDTPTSGRDNVVDRYDGRDFATTVQGLGQNSSGIGAMNVPAEHT